MKYIYNWVCNAILVILSDLSDSLVLQHDGLYGPKLFAQPVARVEVVENDPFSITCGASPALYKSVTFISSSKYYLFDCKAYVFIKYFFTS